MLVAVLAEQHDGGNFAVVLAAVEPVTHCFDQASNRLDAADGRRLEGHFDASVGAVETLQIHAPLLDPGETPYREVPRDRASAD